MVYNAIIIDSANLYYRLKKNSKLPVDIVKRLISFIDAAKTSHLAKGGAIYILFDPLSYSDLGESKNFYHPFSERKKVLPDYKGDRVYSQSYLYAIELLRKYYLYRGDTYKLIYSDEYEADDFCHPLMEKLRNENSGAPFKVALVSNDHDLCAYVTDASADKGHVAHLINAGFENPFTSEEFERQYEFKPTYASVVMYKALLGDQSDNITGAVFLKRAKFPGNVKILCRDYLQKIANEGTSLDECVSLFKKTTFREAQEKKDKDAFDELFLVLSLVSMKMPALEKMHSNVRVVRSALEGKSLEPFVHSNPENKTINDIAHKSIYGISFRERFGKV